MNRGISGRGQNAFFQSYPTYLDRSVRMKSCQAEDESTSDLQQSVICPWGLILPIVFLTITYWLGGLKRTALSFFITFSEAGSYRARPRVCAWGMVMDLEASTKLASVILLSFMVAGGYFVQHVPRFIAWIKYISYTYYTFKIQISAQFYPGETYQCSAGHTCRVEDVPVISAVGFDHRGLAVGVLFMMLIIFRVAAYVALMRIGIGRTSINF